MPTRNRQSGKRNVGGNDPPHYFFDISKEIFDNFEDVYRERKIADVWDHVVYTAFLIVMVTLVCTSIMQWHRYVYNVMYGPFLITEQQLLDTTPDNMWKQYVQVHSGKIINDGVLADMDDGSKKQIKVVGFKTHSSYRQSVDRILVKLPPNVRDSYYNTVHPFAFNRLSVTKLKKLVEIYNKTDALANVVEKPELVSVVLEAYRENPRELNIINKHARMFVGYLTDVTLASVTFKEKYKYMPLLLDCSEPYFDPTWFYVIISIYLYFILKTMFHSFKALVLKIESALHVYPSFFVRNIYQELLTSTGMKIAPSAHRHWRNHLQAIMAELNVSYKNNRHRLLSDFTHGFKIYINKDFIVYINTEDFDIKIVKVQDVEDIKFIDSFVILSCKDEEEQSYQSSLRGTLTDFKALYEEVRRHSPTFDEKERTRLAEEKRLRMQRRQELEAFDQQRQEERRRELEERRRRLRELLITIQSYSDDKRPAKASVIESLSKNSEKYKGHGNSNEDDEEICAICQAEMEIGDDVTKFICPGKHLFHKDCILVCMEYRSRCPLCNHQVEEEFDDNQRLSALMTFFDRLLL